MYMYLYSIHELVYVMIYNSKKQTRFYILQTYYHDLTIKQYSGHFKRLPSNMEDILCM